MLIVYLEKQRENIVLVIVPVQWTFQSLVPCFSLQVGFLVSYPACWRHPTPPSLKAATPGSEVLSSLSERHTFSCSFSTDCSFPCPKCSALNLTHADMKINTYRGTGKLEYILNVGATLTSWRDVNIPIFNMTHFKNKTGNSVYLK